MPVRYLILMPWGRVGSNLLMDLLRQRGRAAFGPRAKFSNEQMNALRPDGDAQIAWARRFFARGVCKGAKEAMSALADPPAFAGAAEDAGAQIIRMRRLDLVKAAVSQLRAEALSRWATRAGETAPPPMALDPQEVVRRTRRMRRWDDTLMAATAGLNCLDLTYEALSADVRREADRLSTALGLPLTPVEIPFRKSTADRLEDAVANWAEVRAALDEDGALDAKEAAPAQP